MKKRILSALLAVLMILPMMFGMVSAKTVDYVKDKFYNEEEKIATMDLVAESENGKIQLYCDKVSGELAVKNKDNGQIILSNPYDVNQKGMSEDVLGQYLSQIFLNFVTIGTSGETTYYSYKDCSTYENQLIITEKEHGISVQYTLGDGRKELLLPQKIEVSKFEALIEQIPEDLRKNVTSLYTKFYPYEKDENGKDVIKSESRKQSMIKQYPICAETPI